MQTGDTEQTAHTLPSQRVSPVWLFADREDAGRQLALRLIQYQQEQPIILALPRGGVPVAYEVAEALHTPLEALPVRKLGRPGQRELGIGAIALGGEPILDWEAIRTFGISTSALARVEAEERAELDQQRRLFRDDRPMPDLHGRTAIIVDDGLATGVTARAAVQAVRALGARWVVLAVPVCAPESAAELRADVDDLVCCACPQHFFAVGLWYRDFRPTPDETVVWLLGLARRRWDEPSADSSQRESV
jgi:predicted phosphoribosyltransferase